MNLDDYKIIGPLCYQGKKDCRDVRCRRLWVDGKMSADCIGYHCAYCDESCGPQGHRCDAAVALLDASRALLDEAS